MVGNHIFDLPILTKEDFIVFPEQFRNWLSTCDQLTPDDIQEDWDYYAVYTVCRVP